jgi:hypothetical protein
MLPEKPGHDRDEAILDAVRRGAYDHYWYPVAVEARGHHGVVYVSGDALKIDGIRINASATLEQRIADLIGGMLVTSRVSDAAWEAATVRCEPCLQTADAKMADTTRMIQHSLDVDAQVNGIIGGLVRTCGKDWIIHSRLGERPNVACNYGWQNHAGGTLTWKGIKVWQPIGTRHDRTHVDYSQTVCLMRQTMEVDGHEVPTADVLRDANLCFLISDEGKMSFLRQPGVPVDGETPKAAPTVAKPPTAPPSPKAPEPAASGIKFVQARNYTKGRIAPIKWVVIHDMEAAESAKTAENVAAWFAGAAAPQASAHYCVDSDSIVQCVKETDTAWHAPGANAAGIGIELAGYAKQTAAEWADEFSEAMLRRASCLVSDICKRHGIPKDFVSSAGLLAGTPGITTHAEVSKAWKKSGHTDPGPNFPLAHFLDLVRG